MKVPKFKTREFVKGLILALTPIPGILLRCVTLVPLGFYQHRAQAHWKVMDSYPTLGDAYSLQARAGESMAMKWGQRNFYYHLAVLLPSTFLLPPLNIIFAIPDITLLAYLGLTATYQKRYSPSDEKLCKDPASLTDPAFLQAAASIGLLSDTERACKEFVDQQSLVVAVCALVASMVFFNISNCISAFLSLSKQVNSSRISHSQLPFWNTVLPTLLIPFRDLGVLCIWIFCYVPCLVFRRLPASFQSRALFAMRSSVKSIQERLERKTLTQSARDDPIRTSTHALQEKKQVVPLAQFLGIYDMLVMVTAHLHFVDVANLSLVSRDIRQTLLPSSDDAHQLLNLRKYTCDPYSRARCWVCTNQICDECRFHRRLEEEQLFYTHLNHCLPRCSKCYLKTLREPRVDAEASPHIDTRRCGCQRPTPSTRPGFFQRVFRRGERPARDTSGAAHLQRGSLVVCRNCNRQSTAELAERSAARLKCEMRGRVTVVSEVQGIAELRRCSKCREGFGQGRRWWCCDICDKECRSGLHGF